jgi:hypothetical protein
MDKLELNVRFSQIKVGDMFYSSNREHYAIVVSKTSSIIEYEWQNDLRPKKFILSENEFTKIQNSFHKLTDLEKALI